MFKKILIMCVTLGLILSLFSCGKVGARIDKNEQKRIMDAITHNQSVEESRIDGSIDYLPIVEMGRYKQKGNKEEPIQWAIAKKTDEAALLISKYIIDYKNYDKRSGCFWQNSELRAWLNNVFYNEAFNSTEKDLILNSVQINRDNYIFTGPGSGFYGNGEDTIDKCFILTLNDWWQYNKTALKYLEQSDSERGSIWTRTRNSLFYLPPGGGPGGGDSLNGTQQSDGTSLDGIRPCIWVKRNDLDLSNAIFSNGYMLRGQSVVDGYETYCLDNNGIIQKDTWVNNKYYGKDGKMYKNKNTPDGKYVNHNGDLVVLEDEINTIDMNNVKSDTWVKTNSGIWFYVEDDRKTMKKGWFIDPQDNQTYYLDEETGIMATGWREIDGKLYYFCEEPAKVPNWYYVSSTDTWLSYGIDIKSYGSMYKDEITPDGRKVDKNGALVKNRR